MATASKIIKKVLFNKFYIHPHIEGNMKLRFTQGNHNEVHNLNEVHMKLRFTNVNLSTVAVHL
jgi:ABC-type uncharacterized transport system substrate-binding protein